MTTAAIILQLRNAALPDPQDEREVLHAPLLRRAAEELERQSALLVKETERADYAWRNTRTIEAARQVETQARTVLEARCRRLKAILRDFLFIDDWHDDAIAPAELIERARAEVGNA